LLLLLLLLRLEGGISKEGGRFMEREWRFLKGNGQKEGGKKWQNFEKK